MTDRRTFVKQSMLGAGAILAGIDLKAAIQPARNLQLSLAQWSLHRTLSEGKMDHLDFPRVAREEFGITAVEYVNTFFGGKKTHFKEAAKSVSYLNEVKKVCNTHGVTSHLIMIDNEGPLSVNSDKERLLAVDNHKKWIDAAKFLGCSSIRVNLHGNGTAEEKKQASIDSLGRLGTFARAMQINILVENHGNESSDAAWVANIMKAVNLSNVGTLPDFGNFCLTHPWGETQSPCEKAYDRYQGIREMMPFAKGVSAKSYDFDTNGEQPLMDYKRLMDIVKSSGFNGFIGIEFEGKSQPEAEGIRKTKSLIEKYL